METLPLQGAKLPRMEKEHLQNLNPEQAAGVTHHLGPILILAGAGSGKTRVLTRRIAHLVLEQGVRPSSILAVTFTNKAAGEMRERLEHILGRQAKELWMSTFHSAGLRILRRNARLLGYTNDFVVYDDQDSREILKGILKEKNIDDKRFPVAMFSRAIDQAKNACITPEEFAKRSEGFEGSLKSEVYDLYQRTLLRSNAMDFGDLLANTALLFRHHPDVLDWYQRSLDFILVDEFQDTNDVQYLLIRQLAGEKKNLFVVGDDDQSIYAFRGATIRNILEFEKDFPGAKIIKLEQNYRSTSNILDAAHAVIEKNKQRKPKKLWTDGAKGAPIATFCAGTENEEADYIAREIRSALSTGMRWKDIAIFYRTNAQSRAVEEALVNHRIPYRIFGGLKFYDRKEIKDILAYLRLVTNPSDNQAFLRVINTPTRGIGAQAVQNLVTHARDEGLSLYEAATKVATSSKPIREFVSIIEEVKSRQGSIGLSELIRLIIEKSDYGPRLKKLSSDVTAQSRLENLQELVAIGAAMELSGEGSESILRDFLDRVALTAGSDVPTSESSAQEKNGDAATAVDAVSLMTLHLAKGLEFDLVFFTGLEEGLVPHYRSLYDPIAMEEERRLCYVGITRARHFLHLTRARKRGMFSSGGDLGSMGQYREASRFIFDVPRTLLAGQGGGFFDSGEDYIERRSEELLGDEYETTFSKTAARRADRDGKRQTMRASISNLVKTADDAFKEEPKEKYVHLPMLELSQAGEGVGVFHPSFGKGTVERLEGNEDEATSTKVVVKFEKFADPKKLVFKYAGLRAAE